MKEYTRAEIRNGTGFEKGAKFVQVNGAVTRALRHFEFLAEQDAKDAALQAIGESTAQSARKYPSYTLAQLEAIIAEGRGNPVMVQEVAARKAGSSIALAVPQILGGKAQVKVGRM